MKIIVCMKQTGQTTNRPDRSGVEAALRLKAQTDASVKVIYIGKADAMGLVREAVSMGCDSGSLIECDSMDNLDALALAKLLALALSGETYDVIFTGCYAADADAIQTGLLLAGILHLPHASFVSLAWPVENPAGFLCIKRQMEDRFQCLQLQMPCLISALPLPNQPIYPTADGITRAYASDITVISASDLSDGDLSYIKRCRHFKKEARKKGTLLTVSTEEAVDAMIAKIKSHHLL